MAMRFSSPGGNVGLKVVCFAAVSFSNPGQMWRYPPSGGQVHWHSLVELLWPVGWHGNDGVVSARKGWVCMRASASIEMSVV